MLNVTLGLNTSMILERLYNLLSIENFDNEICIKIKTNITDSSGKSIDFIYEIEDLEVLLQCGDSKILAITGNLLKQMVK